MRKQTRSKIPLDVIGAECHLEQVIKHFSQSLATNFGILLCVEPRSCSSGWRKQGSFCEVFILFISWFHKWTCCLCGHHRIRVKGNVCGLQPSAGHVTYTRHSVYIQSSMTVQWTSSAIKAIHTHTFNLHSIDQLRLLSHSLFLMQSHVRTFCSVISILSLIRCRFTQSHQSMIKPDSKCHRDRSRTTMMPKPWERYPAWNRIFVGEMRTLPPHNLEHSTPSRCSVGDWCI